MGFKRQADLPYPQPWEFILDDLGHKRDLFFVDVGAYDGLLVSNTAYMELDLGWQGICIEPNPVAFENLIQNRNCNCYNIGISHAEGNLPFLRISGYAEMLSGFPDFYDERHMERINNDIATHGGSKETINIEVKKLDTVLSQLGVKKVDYLSIDAEGNEENIIKSINFNDTFIGYLSVENNYKDLSVENYLRPFGLVKIANICSDDIYKHKSL